MQTLLKDVVARDLLEYKVRYSLNYDRQILIVVKGDMNVRLKGNDGHGYLYVGDNDGPRR